MTETEISSATPDELRKRLLDADLLIRNIYYLTTTLMAKDSILDSIQKRTRAYIERHPISKMKGDLAVCEKERDDKKQDAEVWSNIAHTQQARAERAESELHKERDHWADQTRTWEERALKAEALLREAREVLEWTEDDDWWSEPGFEERRDALLARISEVVK